MHLLTARAHLVAATIIAIAAALLVPGAAQAAATPRLIVGFAADADAQVGLRAAGVSPTRARSAAKTGLARLDAVVVPVASGDLQRVRRSLLARADVRYVEVDHVAHASDLQGQAEEGFAPGWRPNDTFRADQWALDTLGAETAWELSRGTGALIAVVDSGVDYIHPDLSGRVDLGPDLVDKDSDPMDVQGHGTHVAGAAAASADDSFGVVGVAPNARILAVRVLDAQGAGNYSVVARGILHAADAGADAINLSLGGPEESELLREAIDYAASRGAVVTCASGNESQKNMGYPARYDSCMAVGASDAADGHAAFSNTGAGIDITAPGVQILSSTMGGSHESWDGTSMATPYVSGVVALLASQGLGRRAILDAITGTSRDLGPAGADTTFGAGRIDAAAAVAAASRTPRGAADATAPSITQLSLLPVKRQVRSTVRITWKLRKRTAFRRVGTSEAPGRFTWQEKKETATTRVVHTYISDDGIVFRSTATFARQRAVVKQATALLPIVVQAADDQGVDRVAFEVDGRTKAVDWSAGDGWGAVVPCTPGTHTYVVHAYDTADNRTSSTDRRRVTC